MRISDWSSDVCSSDLAFCERFENAGCEACQAQTPFDETDCEAEAARHFFDRGTRVDDRCEGLRLIGRVHRETLEVFGEADRKSVVSGTSVSVRVDLGGRRIINTKPRY